MANEYDQPEAELSTAEIEAMQGEVVDRLMGSSNRAKQIYRSMLKGEWKIDLDEPDGLQVTVDHRFYEASAEEGVVHDPNSSRGSLGKINKDRFLTLVLTIKDHGFNAEIGVGNGPYFRGVGYIEREDQSQSPDMNDTSRSVGEIINGNPPKVRLFGQAAVDKAKEALARLKQD